MSASRGDEKVSCSSLASRAVSRRMSSDGRSIRWMTSLICCRHTATQPTCSTSQTSNSSTRSAVREHQRRSRAAVPAARMANRTPATAADRRAGRCAQLARPLVRPTCASAASTARSSRKSSFGRSSSTACWRARISSIAGGTAQPVGQRFFASFRARRRQQLKQASPGRTGRDRGRRRDRSRSGAVGAGAGPHAVHPLEPADVEALAPARRARSSAAQRVDDHQRQEPERRDDESGDRDGSPGRTPARPRPPRREAVDESQVGDERVTALAVGDRLIPAGNAPTRTRRADRRAASPATAGLRVGAVVTTTWRAAARARRTLPSIAACSSSMDSDSSAVCATWIEPGP